MRSVTILSCLAMLASLPTCRPNPARNRPSNEGLRAKLDDRARFDLDCKDIQLQPLEVSGGYAVSYGVTGCGKRATYVLNSATNSWVMNVADGKPTGQTPSEIPQRQSSTPR